MKNYLRLAIFLLLAFLPMVGTGLFLHLSGAAAGTDTMSRLIVISCSAGAMLYPLVAVILTRLIFKESLFEGLGISFRINRWWVAGWLLMAVLSFATLGISILMPGEHWSTDSEALQAGLQQMGVGVWGYIGILTFSGLLAGITVNALFAFGEEIAWRGYLVKLLEGRSFTAVCLIIGTIWGLWHSPLILTGHNYPQHPFIGVFMMILLCITLTPMLLYFRKKSGSVIVPAIMHGTFNALAGLTDIFVAPANDLLIGGPGIAGISVLLMADLGIFIFEKRSARR